MNQYTLFLDESKPNTAHPYFCLGGCIIEHNYYEQSIVPFVENIKMNIWGDKSIILHETDIRDAKKADYRIMRNPQKREAFWNYMKKLFDSHAFSVTTVVYEPAVCQSIYKSRYLNDEYFSSLQIVMENYAYFLEQHDARGAICIESRNDTDDNRLKAHYFNLMANGTLFLRPLGLQNHITDISFIAKPKNNIGLQIADFIPNTIKKHAYNKRQKEPSLISNILPHLYDGEIGDFARFGIRKILN